MSHKFHNNTVRIVTLLAAGLMLVSPAFGQVVTATLTGSITDSSGGSVPNASVKVTERSTGVTRSSNTSVDGVYNVPYLNPGVYLVEVDAAGFKKYSQDNVRLAVTSAGRSTTCAASLTASAGTS
jgi:Carboxypeptidase regulatory-like domain